MRLAWATDIHLNFVDEDHVRGSFCPSVRETGAEALLLGGDIAEAPSLVGWLRLLADVLAPLPIYFVLGNHDYYHGSIAPIRAACVALGGPLRWLPGTGPIHLTATAALVGHGGWGDGRLGDFLATPIRINDHVLIKDLAGMERRFLLGAIARLGDEAAASLRRDVTAAIGGGAQRVVVLTHVPPFRAACWHDGRTPPPDSPWLPDFTCGATGDALRAIARDNPAVDIEVLCGHTHGAGQARIRDNLWVQTGGADYGSPGIAGTIDL